MGYALMIDLPNHGFNPIGTDILKSDRTDVVGDFTDRTFVNSVFTKYPSIRYVLHAGTLHKPHVGSHTKEDFINVNITGTLILLEEASKTGNIEAFIYTSTTSTFGAALAPAPGQPGNQPPPGRVLDRDSQLVSAGFSVLGGGSGVGAARGKKSAA